MKRNLGGWLEESSSSEDTDSNSSSGDKKLVVPINPAVNKPMDSAADSDGSDSDSPVPAKPNDDRSKLKYSRSNTSSTPSKSMASPPAKRAKKEKAESTGDKLAPFQRLWSDDDEIAVLKGMVEFKKERRMDPIGDAVGFHNFVKESLNVDVDRRQLLDKIRRLKKRFLNSGSKKKFSPHEQKAFDLSKKIWGKFNTKTSMDSKPAPRTCNETKEVELEQNDNVGNSMQFIGRSTISMGLDEDTVKVGLELCSEDKKAEIEEKWKKLYLEESNLFLRKIDLVREETNMITQALKSVEN